MSSDPGQTPQPIRFGEDLELDPAAYQLRRAGRPLKLERIPLEILLLLAERPGQLVTREQIAERIWGKGAFLDVDNSLNGAIRKIRQVLEDDPEQPRFIQTVTGRGYRFVAPVLEARRCARRRQPAPRRRRPRPGTAAAGPGSPSPRRCRSSSPAPSYGRGREPPAAPRGRVMLAVLPFQNLTGDEGQEYLSDGLTEEMIAQLGKRDPKGLGVIARTSVMQYKHSQEPPQRIGRELGVQYLLSGSVRRDSSTIRVTAQLDPGRGPGAALVGAVRSPAQRPADARGGDRARDHRRDRVEPRQSRAGLGRRGAGPAPGRRGLRPLPQGAVLLQQADGHGHRYGRRRTSSGSRNGTPTLPAAGRLSPPPRCWPPSTACSHRRSWCRGPAPRRSRRWSWIPRWRKRTPPSR